MKYRLKVNLKVSSQERHSAGAILDDQDPKYADLIKRNIAHFEKVESSKVDDTPSASSKGAKTSPPKPAAAPATNKKTVTPPAAESKPEPKAKSAAQEKAAKPLLRRNK